MKKETKCDICGKSSVMEKKITRSFGKGDNVVVIDDIPLFVCSHCGESYFSAETLQEIERIRMHHGGLKARCMAPVLTYV
jgi:YgiT-type zinc finger domain-containing protein